MKVYVAHKRRIYGAQNTARTVLQFLYSIGTRSALNLHEDGNLFNRIGKLTI